MRIFLAAFVLLAWVSPALASDGEVDSYVRTIADVNENARSGDSVVVEGEITDVATGSGSRHVVTLQDDTGVVLIRVPEHLLRHLNEGHDPKVGGHVRVAGKWSHAYLDDEVWGIHAQDAQRIEK